MIDLITMQAAKSHLRVTDSNSDYDIASKVTMASAIVMDYIKESTVPDEWIDATVSPVIYNIPALIQAATLLVCGELFYARESSSANVLSDAVKSLLHRYRDPAMA